MPLGRTGTGAACSRAARAQRPRCTIWSTAGNALRAMSSMCTETATHQDSGAGIRRRWRTASLKDKGAGRRQYRRRTTLENSGARGRRGRRTEAPQDGSAAVAAKEVSSGQGSREEEARDEGGCRLSGAVKSDLIYFVLSIWVLLIGCLLYTCTCMLSTYGMCIHYVSTSCTHTHVEHKQKPDIVGREERLALHV